MRYLIIYLYTFSGLTFLSDEIVNSLSNFEPFYENNCSYGNVLGAVEATNNHTLCEIGNPDSSPGERVRLLRSICSEFSAHVGDQDFSADTPNELFRNVKKEFHDLIRHVYGRREEIGAFSKIPNTLCDAIADDQDKVWCLDQYFYNITLDDNKYHEFLDKLYRFSRENPEQGICDLANPNCIEVQAAFDRVIETYESIYTPQRVARFNNSIELARTELHRSILNTELSNRVQGTLISNLERTRLFDRNENFFNVLDGSLSPSMHVTSKNSINDLFVIPSPNDIVLGDNDNYHDYFSTTMHHELAHIATIELERGLEIFSGILNQRCDRRKIRNLVNELNHVHSDSHDHFEENIADLISMNATGESLSFIHGPDRIHHIQRSLYPFCLIINDIEAPGEKLVDGLVRINRSNYDRLINFYNLNTSQFPFSDSNWDLRIGEYIRSSDDVAYFYGGVSHSLDEFNNIALPDTGHASIPHRMHLLFNQSGIRSALGCEEVQQENDICGLR